MRLLMSSPGFNQQALNKAMMEAVDFVHAEGWEAPPTLFALVPTELVVDQIELDDSSAPLTLVVQDNLPDNILLAQKSLPNMSLGLRGHVRSKVRSSHKKLCSKILLRLMPSHV